MEGQAGVKLWHGYCTFKVSSCDAFAQSQNAKNLSNHQISD